MVEEEIPIFLIALVDLRQFTSLLIKREHFIMGFGNTHSSTGTLKEESRTLRLIKKKLTFSVNLRIILPEDSEEK